MSYFDITSVNGRKYSEAMLVKYVRSHFLVESIRDSAEALVRDRSWMRFRAGCVPSAIVRDCERELFGDARVRA